MKEGDNVSAQLFEGRVISVELPKPAAEVTYTEGAVKVTHQAPSQGRDARNWCHR